MEFFGFIAFVMALGYSSYPMKFRKLERQIKKMNGGNLKMSKIIAELIGKSCRILPAGDFASSINAVVLDVDSDWVKIEKMDAKGNSLGLIEIMRIDEIKTITLNEKEKI